MKSLGHKILVWSAVTALLILGYNQITGGMERGIEQNLYFSDFMNYLNEGKIEEIKISKTGGDVSGIFKDGTRFRTNIFFYDSLVQDLRRNNVKFKIASSDSFMSIIGGILMTWLPMIILIGIWILFIKQMQNSSNKAMGFGKSKARMIEAGKSNVNFSDIAGINEAKDELYELVDFLKDPKKFKNIGAKIPRGCLLVGSPGTGKTLLARAIAGEAKVHFFNISGSDFVEMFVGVGASRVRDMFDCGKKHSPCIIFIDEIDAVGRHRGVGIGGGNDEREQTLNQLLVEMDGFESSEGIIVIAATNRPDVLDPALLRPGRFDRRVIVPLPDIRGRSEILDIHIKKITSSPDVDIKVLAKATPGFSGADLSNLVNEAALYAARQNKKIISMVDMEYAKDKVMMGVERKSMILSEKEKKLTAYHEAGHAIAAFFIPESDKLYKITIIPRGQALGLVMRLPDDDRLSVSKIRLIADIKVAVAGRIAEEMIFGKDSVTSGACSDIIHATDIARSMVMQWGMSDKIGPICYHSDNIDKVTRISEEKMKDIDREVKKIVDDACEFVRDLLKRKRENLELLVEALLKYETLNFDQVKDLMSGKKIKIELEDADIISSKSSFNIVDEEDLKKKDMKIDEVDYVDDKSNKKSDKKNAETNNKDEIKKKPIKRKKKNIEDEKTSKKDKK